MSLSTESTQELGELIALAADPRVRYRVYTFQTVDVRLAAEIADTVERQFDGAVLDALEHGPLAISSIAVSALDLVAWVASTVRRSSPYCLIHVDAVLSMWTSATEHRVWWEQLALLEAFAPLLVFTARSEVATVESWGYAGELQIGDSAPQLWAPRRSSHYHNLAHAGPVVSI